MNKILKVESIEVKYTNNGQVISLIKDLDFSIDRGEVIGIIGFSGSGKSLTALSIMGLATMVEELSVSGTITFDNKIISKYEISSWQQIRGKDIAIIFQNPLSALNPLIPCIEQIKECILTHQPGLSNDQINALTDDLLLKTELHNVDNIKWAYPHQLSGGQLQRVVIAMAISNRPKLIIADEPTSSLDTSNAESIIQMLVNLCRVENTALMFITHDLKIIEDIADSILFISDGKKIDHVSISEYRSGRISRELEDYKASVDRSDFRNTLPENAKEVLRIESIYKSFSKKNHFFKTEAKDSQILNDVSLSVRKGEMLGILGNSGSGKTTLAKIISGLLLADSGRLFLNGKEYKAQLLDNDRELRKKIQMVLQDAASSLQPKMKIYQQWEEVARIYKASEKIDAVIEYWLGQTGLSSDILDKYPYQLSGGQQQRVALVKPLLTDPDIICFDETLSALDSYHQNMAIDLIIKIQEEIGFSGIFITHDVRLLQRIAHRAIRIESGKIVEEITFRQL